MSVKWKNLSTSRTRLLLCCWVLLESLALPPDAIWFLVVEPFSLESGCGRQWHVFFPSWEFTSSMWCSSSYFLMKLWYWTLRSGSCSSLCSIACSLRSAERRDVPSWVGSILVGNLTINLPSGCWVVCVRKCSSQAFCSAVMVDCSTGSTSQKQFRLCSNLLSSRRRNVCCALSGVVVAGVRPASFQPRTVSCSTGKLPGHVRLPGQLIS